MSSPQRNTPLDRALSLIADVPDYPKPGILFKDITPLLADGPGFGVVIDEFARAIRGLHRGIDAIVGIARANSSITTPNPGPSANKGVMSLKRMPGFG